MTTTTPMDTADLLNSDQISEADKELLLRVRNQIRATAESLEQVAASDVAKLPEHIFVNVFLPFFAGDPEPRFKVDIGIWAGIAGNPFAEVEIIDNKGVGLFRVPPIYDRSVINSESDDRVSIAHIVRSAEQMSNMSPIAGMNYLREQLAQRSVIGDAGEKVGKHLERWKEIFKRYGREFPTAGTTQATADKVEEKAQDQAGEDYDFDPL